MSEEATTGITDDERRDLFLCGLADSLAPAARKQFGPLDRMTLKRSLVKCGLLEYPALSGPHEGDRACGECVCEKCGNTFFDHPIDWRVISYGDMPFLNVLCNGERVKL